jgi:hypothetical protein
MTSIGGPAFRGAGVSPRAPDHPAGRSTSDRLLQSSLLAPYPLADRARLKERDENVRFKQSMTPHVSREGQLVPWKLEANGNASRPIPNLVGFVCGFGNSGDLLQGEVVEHPQTTRAHRDASW